MDRESVGVYVHLPYCERICPYCDFAVVAARRLSAEDEARYVAAVQRELALRAPAFAGRRLASVYLGGGTPALFSPESIERIVAAARVAFPGPPPEEVTLEANPSTLEVARLPGFRAAGATRLSLGIQSFDDAVLRALGRAHRGEEGRAAARAARAAGFEALSFDLLFAAPRQTLESLERDLAEMVELGPDHVSTYELIVEPGTPFELAAQRGQLERPDEDEELAMLACVEARLGAAGYRRYELASYARPGREAVHNARYWQRRPVLGVGLGAFSNDPPGPGAPFGVRRSNPRELSAYLTPLASGRLPGADEERLDARVARGEAVFLSLRRAEGLDAAAFEAEFGAPPRAFFEPEIAARVAEGLLEEDGAGDLRLTARGRRLADRVSEGFV